jgi:hypothetical protein
LTIILESILRIRFALHLRTKFKKGQVF